MAGTLPHPMPKAPPATRTGNISIPRARWLREKSDGSVHQGPAAPATLYQRSQPTHGIGFLWLLLTAPSTSATPVPCNPRHSGRRALGSAADVPTAVPPPP